MNEATRSPIMHSWVKLTVGWWNRIVVRPDTDLVKQALKDNIQEVAFGGQGVGQLDLHNIMIMCGLFDSLVRSVMNSGCEGWAVYHMHTLTSDTAAWGSGGQAEMLHRSFL